MAKRRRPKPLPKVPECKACGKRCYTEYQAFQAAASLRGQRIYYCEDGMAWHTTTKKHHNLR